MATFEAQVKGYTGLTLTGSTVPTQDELTQFLRDGVIDVTSKLISKNPSHVTKFLVESTEQTGNDSLDINGAKIATVLREGGANNDWRECKFIPPSHQNRVEDVDSIFYASKLNPVYTIMENGIINVFPSPTAGGSNSFKVYYVNNVPQDKGGAALLYSHSDIKYFADDKVYLVVLYAAIRVLQAKLSEMTFVEEDPELVESLSTNLGLCSSQYMQELQPEQQAQTGDN